MNGACAARTVVSPPSKTSTVWQWLSSAGRSARKYEELRGRKVIQGWKPTKAQTRWRPGKTLIAPPSGGKLPVWSPVTGNIGSSGPPSFQKKTKIPAADGGWPEPVTLNVAKFVPTTILNGDGSLNNHQLTCDWRLSGKGAQER
jgi:hypothetical protein